MKSLSERLNVKVGEVAGAHVMKNVHLGIDLYDTLCLICAELDVDTTSVSDFDFDSCARLLGDFCNALNQYESTTVSVWFDKV